MHIRGLIEVFAALAASTAVVWALEVGLQAENAGTLYLLAVAVIAIRHGTLAALLAALGAFVIYNLLFVEPRFTLAVARPEELITLLLLLFVGLVIGRLGGAQREREQLAERREREARALFAISRALATSPRLTSAIGTVLERVRTDAGMTRAWIGLGATAVGERSLGDTAAGQPVEPVGTHAVLRRDRPEDSATWVRIRTGSRSGTEGRRRHFGTVWRSSPMERRSGRCGRSGPPMPAHPASRRRGCWRRRRTRWRRRSDATGSPRPQRTLRWSVAATSCDRHCSTRSPTTCGPHWPRSGPRPAALPILPSTSGKTSDAPRHERSTRRRIE